MNISISKKKRKNNIDLSRLCIYPVITNPIITNQIFQTKKKKKNNSNTQRNRNISIRRIERGKREQQRSKVDEDARNETRGMEEESDAPIVEVTRLSGML